MIKLIDTGSFFSKDDCLHLLKFDQADSAFMEKKASDERIRSFVDGIVPAPGKFYLHINAMGSGEHYGANRNADYFPEENLKRYYKTFETGPAHLFRHHINKDPAKAYGRVIFSIYNERMHRVELIVEADRELARDIEERIERGEFPSTSMACKTPFDECSICGNKARTRDEYCDHLRYELGRLYADGRRVMALNTGPLRFFDISIVLKPADVTSSILEKVASEEAEAYGAKSSIEAAEEVGLLDKYAEHKKLSELIKEVPGTVVNSFDPTAKASDPSEHSLDTLSAIPMEHVCASFAEAGIVPSLEYLAELAAKRKLGGEYFPGAGVVGLHLAMKMSDQISVPSDVLEKAAFDTNLDATYLGYARKQVAAEIPACSWMPEFIVKRASEIGYQPVDFKHVNVGEIKLPAAPAEDPDHMDLIQVLASVGISAIVAKMLIAKYLEKNSSNSATKLHISKPGLPAALVKRASETLGNDLAAIGAKVHTPRAEDVSHSPAVHSEGQNHVAPIVGNLTSGAIRLTHAPGADKVARAVGQIIRGVS